MIQRITMLMLRHFPEALFGKRNILQELFARQYMEKAPEEKAAAHQKTTAKRYVMILLAFGILFITVFFSQCADGSAKLSQIQRERGESAKTESVMARLAYQDASLTKKARIRLSVPTLQANEINAQLEAFERSLPKAILGKNSDLAHVKYDLDLDAAIVNSDITAVWECSDPNILDETGTIDQIALRSALSKKTQHDAKSQLAYLQLTLLVTYSLLSEERQTSLTIHLWPNESPDYQKALEKRFDEAVFTIEKNSLRSWGQTLPSKLPDGVSITWEKEEPNQILPLLVILLLLLFLVFRNRYRVIKETLKRDNEQILRDLPTFLDRFVMLTQAGLVSEAAIRKIAEDYQRVGSHQQSTLFDGVCEAVRRMQEGNTPLYAELKEFARKTEVREWVRFCTTLEEHAISGFQIAEQLQRESAMLWLLRKKRAEEKGRVAESKLTFPLALQLLVLMLVTLAPVWIQV